MENSHKLFDFVLSEIEKRSLLFSSNNFKLNLNYFCNLSKKNNEIPTLLHPLQSNNPKIVIFIKKFSCKK